MPNFWIAKNCASKTFDGFAGSVFRTVCQSMSVYRNGVNFLVPLELPVILFAGGKALALVPLDYSGAISYSNTVPWEITTRHGTAVIPGHGDDKTPYDDAVDIRNRIIAKLSEHLFDDGAGTCPQGNVASRVHVAFVFPDCPACRRDTIFWYDERTGMFQDRVSDVWFNLVRLSGLRQLVSRYDSQDSVCDFTSLIPLSFSATLGEASDRGVSLMPVERQRCQTIVAAPPRRYTLSGAQREVMRMSANGAVLIKGGAGSGKTLVSVKRAEYLMNTQSDMFRASKVAIFAYNRELIYTIKDMVGDSSGIDVMGLDAWVYDFLSNMHGRPMPFVNNRAIRQALRDAKRAAFGFGSSKSIAKKSDDFYQAEISWIKGWRITSWEQYRDKPRTGRGREDRVTGEDRQLLWRMFSAYNDCLRRQNELDWDDRVLEALKYVEADGFEPIYTHMVVDEAQDLSYARILLLRHLVSRETNSITLVADSAQRIYHSGFTWREVGINVVGARSRELNQNYRNTRQIAAVANSLISHAADQDELTQMLPTDRGGPKPVVYAGSEGWCKNKLLSALSQFPKNARVAILLHHHTDIKQCSEFLRARGYSVETTGKVHARSSNDRPVIRLVTYYSVKGQEFQHVLLWGVDEGMIPLPNSDDYDLEKQRKLFYVAITRASGTPRQAWLNYHDERSMNHKQTEM